MTQLDSTLAWKILWTEEPGGMQSMGSLRVGHDSATSLSRIGGGNGNPLQCSCLENPRDGGAWWAAVYGIAQSRTRLKRLSSSRYMVMLTCVILLLNILGIAFRFNFALQNICMVLKSNLHEYNFNAFLLQSNWNEFAYFQIKKKKNNTDTISFP